MSRGKKTAAHGSTLSLRQLCENGYGETLSEEDFETIKGNLVGFLAFVAELAAKQADVTDDAMMT